MMTAFGGAVAVPIAVRSRDSTTTIRVNDVIMIRIDGAIESTVKSAMSWIARSVTPPWPPPRLMLMSWAAAGVASAAAAIRKVRNERTLRGLFGNLTKTTLDGRAMRPSRLQDSRNSSLAQALQPARRARRGPGEAAARVQLAAPRSRARPDGEGRLRDAVPFRRDSDPRWRPAERAAAEAVAAPRSPARVRARASAAPSVLPASGAASSARHAACAAASIRAALVRYAAWARHAAPCGLRAARPS